MNETLRSAFGCSMLRAEPLSGGDTASAFRLLLEDGTRVFMKADRSAASAGFRGEAEGLEAIRATGTLRVPEVIALGRDENVGAYLLLEWIEPARPLRDHWEIFGRELAAMHAARTPGVFGWETDNTLGAARQINTPSDSWVSFFRDCRLAPQFRSARHWFDRADRQRAARLLDHLDAHLTEPGRPSLLHGDLWSGNFVIGPDSKAWLIDPAVYRGHPEADLAMTELFGGFHPRFYEAYRECAPLQPGYEQRRDLYNLYHLLNHLNLFGGGYLPPVLQILRRYAG